MSLLIKGMEMPCACVFCELYDGDLYWCRGAKREVPYSPEDKCAEFCPLVPVPEHGDLIKRIVYRGAVYNALEAERINHLDGILTDRYKDGFHDGLKRALEILGGLPDAEEGE